MMNLLTVEYETEQFSGPHDLHAMRAFTDDDLIDEYDDALDMQSDELVRLSNLLGQLEGDRVHFEEIYADGYSSEPSAIFLSPHLLLPTGDHHQHHRGHAQAAPSHVGGPHASRRAPVVHDEIDVVHVNGDLVVCSPALSAQLTRHDDVQSRKRTVVALIEDSSSSSSSSSNGATTTTTTTTTSVTLRSDDEEGDDGVFSPSRRRRKAVRSFSKKDTKVDHEYLFRREQILTVTTVDSDEEEEVDVC